MAVVEKAVLASYFETGSFPNSSQFDDLLDTVEYWANKSQSIYSTYNATTGLDAEEEEIPEAGAAYIGRRYLVTVKGTQDLGEGSTVWEEGDIIACMQTGDSYKWLRTGSGTTILAGEAGTDDETDFTIKTNGNERLRVFANGNVAVGTSIAQSELMNIAGTFSSQVPGDEWDILLTTNSDTPFGSPGFFMYNEAELTSAGLTLDLTGHVTVGHASYSDPDVPVHMLMVGDNEASLVRYNEGDYIRGIKVISSAIQIKNDSPYHTTWIDEDEEGIANLLNSGKLGLGGVMDPIYTLDADGDINARGNFREDGTIGYLSSEWGMSAANTELDPANFTVRTLTINGQTISVLAID